MHFMVYDNEGETLDRYTIFPRSPQWDEQARRITGSTPRGFRYLRPCLSLSGRPVPWHPQGVSQFTTGMPGPHLGKRIGLHDLPVDIRQHAINRLASGVRHGC